MSDRIALLSELGKLPLKMNAASSRTLEKTLNKAIAAMLAGLPLDGAQSAPAATRRLISASFEDSLTMADLKKVSKLWEPKRTVPPSIAHTELARDLTDLMEGRRRPFVPTKFTLPQALSAGDGDCVDLVRGLERFAVAKDLKATLKKWDKFSPLNQGGKEDEIRRHLLALLRGGAEPVPPPPKK
jgi:hypothetical protein